MPSGKNVFVTHFIHQVKRVFHTAFVDMSRDLARRSKLFFAHLFCWLSPMMPQQWCCSFFLMCVFLSKTSSQWLTVVEMNIDGHFYGNVRCPYLTIKEMRNGKCATLNAIYLAWCMHSAWCAGLGVGKSCRNAQLLFPQWHTILKKSVRVRSRHVEGFLCTARTANTAKLVPLICYEIAFPSVSHVIKYSTNVRDCLWCDKKEKNELKDVLKQMANEWICLLKEPSTSFIFRVQAFFSFSNSQQI